MKSDDLEQLLIGYGLTKNQSKVFSTLVNQNYALTAKQISQFNNLARETVYRSLLDLIKRGLVEKYIEFPKKYLAIPLKSALFFLHKQKNIQIHELERLTTQVLVDYHVKKRVREMKEKTQFLLVPEKKQFVTKISNAISNSRKIIRIITSWERQLRAINVYEKAFNNAFRNRVSIQVLLTGTQKKSNLPEYFKAFNDHPNTIVKFVDSPAKIIGIIIDNKEIFMITEPKSKLADSSALWSNNSSLIRVFLTFFDSVWKNTE